MVSDRFWNRHLYAPLGAAGRPRQRPQNLSTWLVRGFLPLLRTAGAKTNLSMCLKRREALSLGRFAERVLTCLDLSAAEVPCKTAPFASFSGRAEKEGPARPERVPIFSSFVRALKKASVMSNFYEIVLTKRYSFLTGCVGRCALAQRPAVYCTSVYRVEAQPSTIGSCGITIASTI